MSSLFLYDWLSEVLSQGLLSNVEGEHSGEEVQIQSKMENPPVLGQGKVLKN
jgi:hypothetical protein